MDHDPIFLQFLHIMENIVRTIERIIVLVALMLQIFRHPLATMHHHIPLLESTRLDLHQQSLDYQSSVFLLNYRS